MGEGESEGEGDGDSGQILLTGIERGGGGWHWEGMEWGEEGKDGGWYPPNF